MSPEGFTEKIEYDFIQYSFKQKSVLDILHQYGEPFLLKRKKLFDNNTHYIAVYKKRIWQFRTRIVYHIVNQYIVSVQFMIRMPNATHIAAFKKRVCKDLLDRLSETFGIYSCRDEFDNLIEIDYNQDMNIYIYPNHQESFELIRKLSHYTDN